LTASISLVCGQLFSSLFFIDFHRTNSSDSAGPFTSFDPVGFAIFATSPATPSTRRKKKCNPPLRKQDALLDPSDMREVVTAAL
jgi:hypothetical protein